MPRGRKPGSTGRVETVVFNDVTFRRYPDSARPPDRTYFTPGPSDRRRGVQRLHQEVWKAAHGPIPDGHDVHHRDHDPGNNDLGNLVCIPGDQHRDYHAHQPLTAAQLAARRINQRATAEWHASQEGRAWHAEHGRRTWEGRDYRNLACEWCGTSFRTRDAQSTTRFCSDKCRAYARKASGVDDVDRLCEGCGATFRINRYARTRNCSRKCAWALRRRAG